MRAGGLGATLRLMPDSSKLDLLRAVPFLRTATKGDLLRIARMVDAVDVPGGYELAAEGALSRRVFIVVHGTATSSAGATRFETVGPGGIAGHVALLDHGRHHATITADSGTAVISIARPFFEPFVHDRAVYKGLLRQLAARLRFAEAELTLSSLQARDARS